MTAQLIYADFKSKTWTSTKSLVEARLEELSRIEQAIAVALWNNDAGTVGSNPAYLAPEKDPA